MHHLFGIAMSPGRLLQRSAVRPRRGAGFNLDEHAFNAVFYAYDPDRSNSLKSPEYIATCVFLRNTAATFQAFDTSRQGRVALDYNQFVYATSNCK